MSGERPGVDENAGIDERAGFGRPASGRDDRVEPSTATGARPSPADIASGFHDAECSHYRADLPYWAGLARRAGTGVRVLDLGAGTGRVAIALARAGYDVAAVDLDPALLDELRVRAAAAGVHVPTAAADLRTIDVDLPEELRGAALLLVPMQTLQLLGGPAERIAFLMAAAAIAGPGAQLAAAIVEEVEPFDGRSASEELLPPDVAELRGFRYESTPLAVLQAAEGDAVDMHRRRRVLGASGRAVAEPEEIVITLDALRAATLAEEAESAGWDAVGVDRLPPTDEHAGSTVVRLQLAESPDRGAAAQPARADAARVDGREGVEAGSRWDGAPGAAAEGDR